jgi:hypothetical protein
MDYNPGFGSRDMSLTGPGLVQALRNPWPDSPIALSASPVEGIGFQIELSIAATAEVEP